jgi:hypothetical protein
MMRPWETQNLRRQPLTWSWSRLNGYSPKICRRHNPDCKNNLEQKKNTMEICRLLLLNTKKTKAMSTGQLEEFILEGKPIDFFQFSTCTNLYFWLNYTKECSLQQLIPATTWWNIVTRYIVFIWDFNTGSSINWYITMHHEWGSKKWNNLFCVIPMLCFLVYESYCFFVHRTKQ